MDPITGWEDHCRRLMDSDRRALEAIYRATRDDLLRYVGSVVRDDAAAHDLVQDVFVALWHMRAALDPSLSLRAYLFRMARNGAYRYLRDERIHERLRAQARWEVEDGSEARGAGGSVDAGVLGAKLARWMDELPERQREALCLSRFHGLSHREIADVMTISPRTVNNHIGHALAYLNEQLQRFHAVAK